MTETEDYDKSATPTAHKTSHQDGGSDEISVQGLAGLLADAQTPLAHKTSHQDGGSDEISVQGLSGLLGDSQTPLAHKTSHQDGGSDEISVQGLSGLLGDSQTPLAHKTSHQDGGTDEISAAGLAGELTDLQKPKDHTHQSPGSGVGGTLDHGAALTGLTDDDHTQYPLLAGRAGGQTIWGGTNSANNLNLRSTSHATKGNITMGSGGSYFYEAFQAWLLTGTFPGFWLDETSQKGAYFLLLDKELKVQRRAVSFGAYEATPILLSVEGPDYTLTVDASGNIGFGASPVISDGVGVHIAGKILRIATQKTPATSGATGNAGEICWDSNYIYICIAANTWRRIPIPTGTW